MSNFKKRYLVSALCVLAGFFQATLAHGKNITAEEVRRIQGTNDNKKTEIIDLRTPAELTATGIIPGAIAINFLDDDFTLAIKRLNKDKQYIIYCRSGGRSGRAEKQMTTLGFNILNYKGGMDEWLAKKYKTQKYPQ